MVRFAAACLLLACADAIVMQHSFQPPYHKNGVPFWKHGAGTFVNNSHIRLTPAKQSRTGYFWNSIKSKLVDWEAEFDFKLQGGKILGGDGFAFWYTSHPEVLGMVYGSADYWVGLGIFFDTYDNNAQGQNPLITAVVNDGTMRYDAGSDGENQAIGKCSWQIRNLETPTRVKIKYQQETLSVSIAITRDKDFEPCFRVNNVKLGTDKYFGFTAHTGDVADAHDIYQLSVTDLTGQEANVEAVRSDYNKYLDQHQEESDHLSPEKFQHQAMTMMHQIQDSLIVLEERVEQNPIGIYETADAVDRLAQQVDNVFSAISALSRKPTVDQDYVGHRFDQLLGEVRSPRTSVPIDRQIAEIKSDQAEMKMMLMRLMKQSGSSSSNGGYSASASPGSSGSSIMGWFWTILYLVIGLGVLIGLGVYLKNWYQARQRRQFKLL